MKLQDALTKLKNADRLIITVSGDIGAGKSTFAKRLSDVLDIPRIYIGQFMREEAAKRHITLDQLTELQKTDDSLDKHFDALQRERSRAMQKAIFEGRTSWHFVEDPTVTVYLAVDPSVATQRIWQDRNDKRDAYGTIEALHQANQKRKKSEITRYKTYYDIDVYDTSNFDIVTDTTQKTLDEVFEETVISMANALS